MQTRYFLLIAIVVAAAVFIGARLISNDYVFFAGYTILQFIVLATAWNILGGYTGYVNFGSAAFFAMGASPTSIKRIAFGISIATTSVAGALLIIIQPVEPSVGREYIGRVFAICVLGGLGSLPGTVIGAMLLGILESFTATFYGPSWAPAVAFGVLLLTLAFRPAGLLGR